ncbi:YwmB family TATA-box binding protein [Sulfobacillus thermosulfidooxidans]|uniref:YwmB family TATA-box binding protein n=1 Tax=Sulfobacillus thermosulfidooxidans TaxID=28034 RepID=UPI0006B42D24|nr:YwmB family TATA-box binding protein [Sulfobacillus thermosulfidooxidans]
MKNGIRNGLWIAGIGFVLWMGASVRAAALSPVMTAFQATKAHPQGFSINGWVQLPRSQSQQNLVDIVRHLSDQTHIRGTVQFEQGTGYQKASIRQHVAGFSSELIAERLSSGATYVVVDRVGSQGFEGLNESLGLVRHVLSRYGPLHLAFTLQGTLPENLSQAQENQVINQAFQAIGAKKVNGIETPQYVSVAGDSGFIAQHDSLQGHPVNIQVALNYNTYWHAEQVDVGTPLVTVTY